LGGFRRLGVLWCVHRIFVSEPGGVCAVAFSKREHRAVSLTTNAPSVLNLHILTHDLSSIGSASSLECLQFLQMGAGVSVYCISALSAVIVSGFILV